MGVHGFIMMALVLGTMLFAPALCLAYRAYHWLRYGFIPSLDLNGFGLTLWFDTDWQGVLKALAFINDMPIEVLLVVTGLLIIKLDD
ncbi:MAG: hypothetical protein RIC36_03125 [Rhodospirillales bacterium]